MRVSIAIKLPFKSHIFSAASCRFSMASLLGLVCVEAISVSGDGLPPQPPRSCSA